MFVNTCTLSACTFRAPAAATRLPLLAKARPTRLLLGRLRPRHRECLHACLLHACLSSLPIYLPAVPACPPAARLPLHSWVASGATAAMGGDQGIESTRPRPPAQLLCSPPPPFAGVAPPRRSRPEPCGVRRRAGRPRRHRPPRRPFPDRGPTPSACPRAASLSCPLSVSADIFALLRRRGNDDGPACIKAGSDTPSLAFSSAWTVQPGTHYFIGTSQLVAVQPHPRPYNQSKLEPYNVI